MPRKKHLTFRAPKMLEEVRSVRLTVDLLKQIDRLRGEVDFSTWVRETLERVVETPEEAAVREVEEYMRRRGVTVAMLQREK